MLSWKHRYNVSTKNASTNNSAGLLPRIYRSKMSASNNTTIHYATTKMLPRIYRSKMSTSTNKTTHHTNTNMLSRIYRSQMSSNNTYYLSTETYLFPRIDRPKMLFKTTSNISASRINTTAN
jgi:hypothetical protein